MVQEKEHVWQYRLVDSLYSIATTLASNGPTGDTFIQFSSCYYVKVWNAAMQILSLGINLGPPVFYRGLLVRGHGQL